MLQQQQHMQQVGWCCYRLCCQQWVLAGAMEDVQQTGVGVLGVGVVLVLGACGGLTRDCPPLYL